MLPRNTLFKKEGESMSFLLGPMRKHIEGRKGLTDSKEVINVHTPDEIAIPLIAMGSVDLEVLVKEGDSVKIGTLLARRSDHFATNIYSSVSGTLKAFDKRFHSSGAKNVPHAVIENDHQYVAEVMPTLDYQSATKEEIVEFIKDRGIVGCGGAGFPTFAKYGSVQAADVLIINAVECEPYLTTDYRVVSDHLEDLVIGTLALSKAANAARTIVAIKVDKKELIGRMKEAFSSYQNVEVRGVPNVYPMGWERTLVYELIKKRYDRLPIEVGAVVNNSTTAIKVAQAMKTGMPIVEKIVTVSGEGIKNPANVSVRVGTPLSAVLEACGGVNQEDTFVIFGGPMMGKTVLKDNYVITTSSNSLTVLPFEESDPLNCFRCGRCNDHCPAGILPVEIQDAEKAKDLDRIVRLEAMSCIECGMCSYICPSKIDVTESVRRAKRALQLRK